MSIDTTDLECVEYADKTVTAGVIYEDEPCVFAGIAMMIMYGFWMHIDAYDGCL